MRKGLLNKTLIVVSVLIAFQYSVEAQTVGISDVTFTPNTQAVLDLSSDRRGFLPPRLELNGDDLPISGTKPAGLMVYNQGGAIGPNGYYYWNGSAWSQIATVQGSLSGSGTVNYLPKWTPTGTALGNSQLFDDGTNVGVATNVPTAKLTVRDGQESATQSDFTEAINKSGVLINTDFADNTYTPGIFWNSQNFEPTKPKAGIYLHQTNGGSKMILGTSTTYASGLTNNGLVIDDLGNIGVNTLSTVMKLQVNATGDDGLGISSTGWASLRMDGADTKSLWIHYGGDGTNDLRFARAPNGLAGWEANVVRFDLDAPDGSLIVDNAGSIVSASLAGSGTRMVTATTGGALTAQAIPGGVLPAGTASQTLYHNGTSWTNTSNLSNDGSTINLGAFDNNNSDQWPLVTWRRDVANGWDEGLIKGSSSRGVWGRVGFGIHMDASKHFGFFSSGWTTLVDIEGGTGRMYVGGNMGLGATNPSAKLHIGPINDNHLYLASSNNAYGWRIDTRDNGGGSVPFRIFKRTSSTDTEVFTILNQNGNVGINTTTPGAKFHVHTTGTGGIGISDDGWASIRMDGADDKSLWIHYGAAGTNDLRFARTGDGFGGWEANIVRFDMDAPSESLVLDGAGALSVGNLGGGGNRIVQANNAGQLFASNDIPGGDGDYIQNQYAAAQGANYWISGEARAKVYNFGHDNQVGSSPAFWDGQFYRRDGQAEMAIDDWFYIRDNDGSVRLQFNSDVGQIVYGPNTGWGRYLRVGGNAGQTDEANIAATDGNLHIDSRSGSAIYLQYYTGNNTYINANGGFTGIGHASPGNTLHINRNSGDNRATVQISNTGDNSWGQTLLIRTTNVGTDGAKILFRSRDTKNWSIGGNSGTDNAFVITEDGGDGQYGSGFGNTRMYFEPGGDVGINNTAPASKLHIGAGNTDGIMIGNYNDQFGWNGSGNLPYTAIRFPGYRDVVSNFTGAMVAAVRTNLCCSGLSQATDLSFFVQPYTATASGDANLYERLRVSTNGAYATDYYYLSDKRLKSNVRDIEFGLDKVMQMEPVSYTQMMPKSFRNDEGSKSDIMRESFGFIAQDLYEVVPDLVDKPNEEDANAYWTVSYGKLTPILVKAIQEQQKQIEEGEKEREELRKEVEELKLLINSMRKD